MKFLGEVKYLFNNWEFVLLLKNERIMALGWLTFLYHFELSYNLINNRSSFKIIYCLSISIVFNDLDLLL